MRTNLFLNYYIDKNPVRQEELDFCLKQNILNTELDRLFIVLDKNQYPALLELIESCGKEHTNRLNNTIKLIHFTGKPMYWQYFHLSHHYMLHETDAANEINILANTDIILDKTSLKALKNFHWKENYCMALCRWDLTKSKLPTHAKFFNRPDSQDTWIVKGGFKPLKEADFTLGVGGCDNKIAAILNQYYKVINPSLDVKTYHLHLSGVRNYINHSQVERLPPPYLQIQPTLLANA